MKTFGYLFLFAVFASSAGAEPETKSLTVTKAFSWSPVLKETCETVMEKAAVCQNVDVIQGPLVDEFLAIVKGSPENRDFVPLSSKERLRAETVLGRIETELGNDRLLEDPILLPSSADLSKLAHDYAHILFQDHRRLILPRFLPQEDRILLHENRAEEFATGFEILVFRRENPQADLAGFLARIDGVPPPERVTCYETLWEKYAPR